MNRLTEKEYWNATYQERESLNPIKVEGAQNYSVAQTLRVMNRHGGGFKKVLEIGGGGSAWLAYLASEYPACQFASLDYSEDGAELLTEFMRNSALTNIDIFKEDFFEPNVDIGEYDFVYSHGVVEHFEDLGHALRAQAQFMSRSGRMFTLIPNLYGILGALTKIMNRPVYDIHVVHNLKTFLDGHRDANLRVIESGYLCSTNFGVLSSCVRDKSGLSWFIYKQLSRLSKAIWMVERRLGDLPATRILSPYIYAVSESERKL